MAAAHAQKPGGSISAYVRAKSAAAWLQAKKRAMEDPPEEDGSSCMQLDI